MEKHVFDTQINRLKDQWNSFYSDERKKAFWEELKNISEIDFENAVNYCLLNSKNAPLIADIHKAIKLSSNAFYEKLRIENQKPLDFFLSINDDGVTCDREFKQKCTEHLKNFLDKKITKKQFDEGCDLLDQAALVIERQKKMKNTEPNKPYKED